MFRAEDTKDLNKVMPKIVLKLALSVDTIDQAASILAPLHTKIPQHLGLCRTTAIGLLNSSLSTPRYSLAGHSDVQERITITL
jgi:hypothetical protein